MIGFAMVIVLFSIFSIQVYADTAWCVDECPWLAGQCMCYSDKYLGVVCDLIGCADIDNDGCFEWDWNNPIRCPYLCEQTGDFYAECTYKPSPCMDECEIGESQCVGAYDAYLGTKQSKWRMCWDFDDDGCGEWDVEVIDCSPVWCVQEGFTAGCYLEGGKGGEPVCEDECVIPQMKCTHVGGNDYRNPCGQYDDDTCLDWASSACGIDCLTLDMEWCPYGCKEPQPLHAVCDIKPEECSSTCKEGETICGGAGKDIFACAYNSDDNCWQYYDSIGNAYNVTHCKWGCENTGSGYAKCKDEPVIGVPTESTPNGTAMLIYHFEDVTGSYTNSSGEIDLSLYVNNVGLSPPGTSKFGDYSMNMTGTSTTRHLESEYKIAAFEQGTFEIWVKNENATFGDSDIQLFYHNLWTTPSAYILFEIHNGDTLLFGMKNQTSATAWALDFPLTDEYTMSIGEWYKISVSWGALGAKLYINHEEVAANREHTWTYYVPDAYSKFRIPGPNDFHQVFFDEVVLYNYQKWYGTSRIMECRPNSTKCSDVMEIDGNQIRPYLYRCGDQNNDTFYEWPTMSYMRGDGLPSVETCEYGCWFNESIGEVECRNDYQYETCEDIDWECIPGTKRCHNGWIEECTENPADSNCYVWYRTTFCDNGCNDEGTACKACGDECKNGESKCFPNGFGGVDYETQQSVWYSVPIVANCTYDYNQKCWRYNVKEMERCPYGCYDQFNTTSNLTQAFCWTASRIEEDYWLLNYTASLKTVRADIATYLTMIFPTLGMKYMFSMAFTLIVAGYTGYRAKSLKIGAFILVLILLLASMTGWLPIELTIFIALGCGFWIMQKLFLHRGD